MIKDTRDQDPGGRYFSILLEQVYNEAPDAMRAALFPGARKAAFAGSLARTEYEYAPRRIADVAIFDPEDRLLALVEVKEKDQNGPDVADQAWDYLEFCDRENVVFRYVTKRSPSVECLDVLQAWQSKAVYYSDLYSALSVQESDAPLVRLFCDYLKEERVAYQPLTDDNLKSLKLLLLLSNNMSNLGHGKMKVAARMSGAASLLDVLVNNVEVLGSAFYMRYRDCFGHKFIPSFSFWPEYDGEKLSSMALKDAPVDYIDPRLVLTGNLSLYSEGRLKKIGSDKSCYVWVGLAFALDRDGLLTKSYSAGVGVNAHLFTGRIPIPDVRVGEVAASRTLAKLVSKQIKRALADAHYKGHAGLKALDARLNA